MKTWSHPTNLAYTLWKHQDKLLYSALLGAISQSLQPPVSHCTTFSYVWTTLASTYAKPSRGHTKQLKTQLKNWIKETKTIDVYLQGITTRLDGLAILGKAVDHEDQIDLILEGLPEDYKNVIDQIEGRDVPPLITELHERLLNHEAKLLSLRNALVSPTLVTANMAQQRNNYKGQNKHRNASQQINQQWQSSPQQQNRNDSRGPMPYLGCCQICGTQGNSAKQCSQLKSYQSPRQQKVSPFMPWNPRANLTVPASYNTTNWLMDRGSTHHIMSDLESLSFHQPYDGATYLWVNPFFHSRIKHVALDYQFIRNQVKSCTLRVVHVSTEDQLADAMTKPLPYPTFISFAGKIGVCKPLHFEGTY